MSKVNRQSTDGLSSVSEDLKFVNISHPGDIRQRKEIRTEIRRHVMKGIGQQRRRPRPKEASLQASRTLFLEAGDRKISQLHGADISSISPSRSLGTFNSFPVEANKRVLELMHFGKKFMLSPRLPVHSTHLYLFQISQHGPLSAVQECLDRGSNMRPGGVPCDSWQCC